MMETQLLARFRDSVLGKRRNLAEWLRSTPSTQRQLRLGPAGDQALQQHLEVLENTAEKATTGELGICVVCDEHVEDELLEMDYTACVCLDHLSPYEARQLESELELAAAVQRSLLPQQVPDSPYLQTAAFSRPAQIVGGDYFGFYRFQDGAEGLAIADVAGHGVAASLHMASIHALLHTLVPANTSPAAILAEVDRLFVHNVNFTTFVTTFLSAYDAKTRTLTYCNAGHNPPLLITGVDRGECTTHWLRPTAPAVGLVEGAEYAVARVQVNPGDLLVLFTDGVTEARNLAGDEFGEERLAAAVEPVAGRTAGEILQAARRALEGHADGQPLDDDTTIVVQKIKA
jgi:sigma-B regulation protein RsbU (phosphoserine phosphatase)